MMVKKSVIHREELSFRLLRAALFLLPPVTAFYLMQFLYGAWQTAPGAALANVICVGALYFLMCGLTGRPAVCCVLLHILCGLWGTANYFVALYRGSPVLPWDLTALGTAAAVSGSYSYRPTWQMAVGLALIAGLIWLLRGRAWAGRSGLRTRAVCLLAGALCLVPVVQTERLGAFGVKTDVWDQVGAYRTGGALAVFLRNTEFMQVEEPEDMSPQRLGQILNQVVPEEPAAVGAERPNIVAIMNESWADFEEFGNLSLSESVTDTFRTLDNGVWGHAYTSVFGAGTSASEFEFLTGNSMAFLPSGSIPYQQYILDDAPSMASLLKEAGYRTLAFHPGERTSWQRDRAYPRLGFDQFKCGEDMDVPQSMEHGYVSDRSDFEQIIWEFEHKAEGEPLFLFNVTIQNHGSYTVENYPAQVQLTDQPGRYPMAEQYLTLANKTDESFKLLVDYFSRQQQPTIILMFGDHQPSVEQEFLDKAYGVTQDQMTMEQYMGRYQTPFLIWANYPLPQTELPVSSLNFLGQHLLSLSGIRNSVYGDYLSGFEQQFPVFTFVGYMGADGKAYSHLESNRYDSLIEDYRAFAYNNLFGAQQRCGSFFQPPQ